MYNDAYEMQNINNIKIDPQVGKWLPAFLIWNQTDLTSSTC